MSVSLNSKTMIPTDFEAEFEEMLKEYGQPLEQNAPKESPATAPDTEALLIEKAQKEQKELDHQEVEKPAPKPASETTSFFSAPIWSPDVSLIKSEPLIADFSAINRAIESAANSCAVRLKPLFNELSLTLKQINSFKAHTRDLIQQSIKLGGGNLALIEHHRATQNFYGPLTDFLVSNIDQNLHDLIKHFVEIEAISHLVKADVNVLNDKFLESATTLDIINDFSSPIEKIDSLEQKMTQKIEGINQIINKAEGLIFELEQRALSIDAYLKGPFNPQLFHKKNEEFEKETLFISAQISDIKDFIKLLNETQKMCFSMLENFNKEKARICDLQAYNLQCLIGEFRKKPAFRDEPNYNLQPFSQLFNA